MAKNDQKEDFLFYEHFTVDYLSKLLIRMFIFN